MSAAAVNWLIEMGATLSQSWAFKSGGVAVELTDWHARLQIRPTPESPTLIFDASDTLGNITISEVLGIVTVTDDAGALEAADINHLPTGKEPVPDATKTTVVTACGRIAWYGLDLIDDSGTIYRVLQGKVVLSPWVVAP